MNQSYLAAWIDPDTPPEQEGYVWVFPRQGGSGKRKAPKNIFYETDLYTIRLKNGVRDVRIEKSLSLIEGMFAKVRDGPIKAREHVDDDDRTPTTQPTGARCATTAGLRGESRHVSALAIVVRE